MEESSEAHMETDVSSTTEDVPETQEVTGSHGNVEMVIVVEKVEEDMDSSTQPDKETSQVDDNTNVVSATTENSPQKVSKPQVSLIKSPNKVSEQVSLLKSPIKVCEAQKSPSRPEPSLKGVNKETQPNEVQTTVEMQETEVVDSSCMEPQPLEATEDNTSKEPQKPIEKSPIKDVPTQDALKAKPTQKSPLKDIVLQEATKKIDSPLKEFTLPENSVVNSKIQCNDTVIEDNSTTKQASNTNVIPVDVTVEREASNDSQVESNTDPTEKDHNKSISRELKSLINSAKESKIISECNQLTSKTRKSRTLDTSNASLNTTVEADKIQGSRRYSNNSQKSNCSEKSDKALKRSMRSQNPEFVNKVKLFLNSVTGKAQKDSDDEDEETEENEKGSKERTEHDESVLSAPAPKMKKTEDSVTDNYHKLRSDPYCWRCHWAVEQAANEKAHSPMLCTVCPRAFHYKCLTSTERSKISVEKNWVCPECIIVLQAESSETRSPAMKKIPLGMLCELLKHALDRMMELNGVEPFMQPVDRSEFPHYDKYVVHPMDLSLMRTNIAEGLYGSTEAFLADAQWILHNSIIFNGLQSKLTGGARALVRWCRAQAAEIEACPECYAAAHARRPTWFSDVCTTPHVLLWAKLKGFPYWPAKGMSVSAAGNVDVRFFGAHDRAWVPAKDCYLFSEKDPNNFRTKRQDILDSMQEAEQHIRNISRKYGKFVYPPFKTQFDPSSLYEQLKMMIPSFEGEVKSPVKPVAASPAAGKEKSRSNSKSSKGSGNDGDGSECEDAQAVSSRKMADGAEIAREDDDAATADKNNTSMDVDTPQSKENESSRKRRRSALEEAVFTIIETSTITGEKKKRVEDKTDDKPKPQEPTSSKETESKPQTADKPKDVAMTGVGKGKAEEVAPKTKDNEPSSSTPDKDKKEERRTTPRVTPIRIALVQKDKKNTPKSKDTTPKISPKDNAKTIVLNKDIPKVITPNKDVKTANKDEKITPQRQRPVKQDKTPNATPKDDKSKSEKRRNSRSNKSLNNSTAKDKNGDKKAEKNGENKDKPKENSANKDLENNKEKVNEKQPSPKPNNVDSPKSVKDRLHFDDDTTLAVIARESGKSTTNNGLPTISSVRSLSTTPNTTTATRTNTNAKTIEVTVEANSECSIFTPTSTDNVRTMKDAVSKLQKLRSDAEPVVGRVGVRAFARMTSPENAALPENQNKKDDVQVEIKSEPIDLDDPERHMEKMDLMNAFKLRPVNPTNLREVRINKVVVTPLPARKVVKPVEVRPRAKKTFPQPKKPDDGRSELNGKNSMVYIPIQPPTTQAPARAPRAATNTSTVTATATAATATATPVVRPHGPVITSISTHQTKAMSSPVMQVSSLAAAASPGAGVAGAGAAIHTVPLMTSVNGQWMFSFQPVMSVGTIDRSATPPLLNGVAERSAPPASAAPAAAAVLSGTAAPAAAAVPLSTAAPPVLHATTITATRPAPDNNPPGEPPRLQQRPAAPHPLEAGAGPAALPPPPAAGPLTAKLNQNAVKLADYFRSLLEDSLEKVEEPAAQLTALRLQLEHAAWRHRQELDELKHNHELTLAEMRASFEKEKARAAGEARRAAQADLDAAVKRAKAKQWCANCSQEAQFYCCWNTSYCDYPCQRAHWAQHFSVCTQQRSQDGNNGTGSAPSSPEHRLQPQPDMPKNSSAPALTVGGKLAPSRVYTQDQTSSPKTSIIVSMVEDPNGNQTMKCVGTYKPSAPAQPPPIILNKQLLNSEESVNKKVVSTGGYLIVGAGGNAPAVVARRSHPVQYYT